MIKYKPKNFLKSKYKSLYSFYRKALLKCHKQQLKYVITDLDYFVLYLRYMRDYYTLSLDISEIPSNFPLAALTVALSEYNLYFTCLMHYYTISSNGIESKFPELTEEELQKQYRIEQQEHWDRFWNIINNNIETWFSNDITIQKNKII